MAARKIGSARIVRELGRGAMGIVYEAVQDNLERVVAVKELPAQAAKNRELAERFRREGIAYAKLVHENLLQVYDFVDKNDCLYLITEFVDGADLGKVLQKGGALPPGIVAAIGARVAYGLAYAHEHKMLHRDVKPANIILSRAGEVKLTDFGIAKDLRAADLTRDGMVVGSLPFMAPEVLASGAYDARTDVWALGVTLYELATALRPFDAKEDSKLMAQIVNGGHMHVRKLAPMPRRLGRAIERCLARRPGKRWPHAVLLARELEECAEGLLGTTAMSEALSRVLDARGFEKKKSALDEPVRGDTALDANVMHETVNQPRKGGKGALKANGAKVSAAKAQRGGRDAPKNDTRWLALALMAAATLVGVGWFLLH